MRQLSWNTGVRASAVALLAAVALALCSCWCTLRPLLFVPVPRNPSARNTFGTPVHVAQRSSVIRSASDLNSTSYALIASVLVVGAVRALSSSREAGRVVMYGGHDRRTFRGKQHRNTFGKSRRRLEVRKKMRFMRENPDVKWEDREAKRSGPEPEHTWDLDKLMDNPMYTLKPWVRDRLEMVLETSNKAPKQEVAKQETPKEEKPKKEAPKPEAAKEEPVKEEKPKKEAPKPEAAKEEPVKEEKPKKEAPKPEATKEEPVKEKKPKKEAPKPEAAKEEPVKEEKPKEEAPKQEAAKEEAPKDEKPKEEAPKPEAAKEEAPKEEKPKEEAPKPEAVKEEPVKEEKPKEAPKPEATKEEAPKEEKPKEAPKPEAVKEAVKEEKPKEEAPKQEAAKKEAPKEEKPKDEFKVTAAMVKELRGRSGAAMLDTKKALTECKGDMEAAMAWLRKKGMAKADKKSSNVAVEGAVSSYVHFNQKIAVLAEVNCETDFVARNEIFQKFVSDVAMQVAANPSILCVTTDEVPKDVVEKEKEIEMGKDDLEGKPDNIKEKIVAGRLKKKYEEMALMGQKWLLDEEKTVEQVLKELIAKLGENVVIRRFSRFNLGDGLDKKDDDFAAGVEKELAKYRSAGDDSKEAAPKAEAPKEEAPKEEEKPKEEFKVTAAMVKELRGRSGAAMLDTKKALVECQGDMEKAMDWLKKRGIAKADKKSSNVAVEGAIASYVHFNKKLGVMVEVNCETDFVAQNSIFKDFLGEVAMQIAANPDVVSVSTDDVPEDVMAKEKEIEMSKEDLEGKPDNIKEKIVAGRLKKKYAEMSLMEQKWLMDEDKKVSDIVKEKIAKLGENIIIRRFDRIVLGEGLEKKEVDFAAEVEAQMS